MANHINKRFDVWCYYGNKYPKIVWDVNKWVDDLITRISVDVLDSIDGSTHEIEQNLGSFDFEA